MTIKLEHFTLKARKEPQTRLPSLMGMLLAEIEPGRFFTQPQGHRMQALYSGETGEGNRGGKPGTDHGCF